MRFLVSVAFCGLFAHQAFSQTSNSNPSTVGDDILLYFKLTGHTMTAPLRWDEKDGLTACGVVAGTGAAALIDNGGYTFMERNQNSFNTHLSDVVVNYGSGVTGVALAGSMYISGLAFSNTWLRETSILMASALSVSVATELALKLAVGRARPYTGEDHFTFKPFSGKSDYVSFPSGHTVVAFTLSTVLSERIDNTWASIGLYGLATTCAFSRMYTREHWFSDIVFAGTMSTFAARSVVKWYESGMARDDGTSGLRIIPQSNGVTMLWRF